MIRVLICDGAGTLQLPSPSLETRQLIEALPGLGIELAVASNGTRREVERNFHLAGLDVPKIIVTKDDIGYRKPKPDFVYKIQEKAGVELKEIAYLGDDDRTDIFCAINAGVLPFAAHYSNSGKPLDYGIQVRHPVALFQYLTSFGLQDSFFGWSYDGHCRDTDKLVEVHVLFGQHGPMGITEDLKKTLKTHTPVFIGSHKIEWAHILFIYLLSSLYLSGLAQRINWITVYPGHKANSTNPILEDFLTTVASVFKQRFIPNLLVRHTDAPKSQYIPGDDRDILDQFRTILANKEYAGKLRHAGGKTVLVLDDFTASGHSLETARRMLLKAGAKQVISVAFGKYRNAYITTRISKEWDPYQPCILTKDDIRLETSSGRFNNVADEYFQENILSVYG